MRFLFSLLAGACLVCGQPKDLTIYYIDVEGGQSTLFVAPSGESLLVDTGSPGGRDTGRIMQAIQDAGVKQIDNVILTHYDGDHAGGLKELSDRIAIRNFYDHGAPFDQHEQVQGFQAMYPTIYAKGTHHVAKVGDKIPFQGIDVMVVTSGGQVLKKPLPGAGKPNPACAAFKRRDEADDDNKNSVGTLFTYGKFRTIDLGDFTWNYEYDLMCPNNPIGTVDLYLTSHHGIDRSGSAVLVHALHPLVAIMNDGPRKGGTPQTMGVLQSSPGLEDIWELHWAYAGGLEFNPPGRFIANEEDPDKVADFVLHPDAPPSAAGRGRGPGGTAGHTPAYWIKVTAHADGSFTVLNARNNFSKTYQGGRR
jgi:competence protein ComEC